ncbi:MAG: hypothetical protein H6818_08560 [Phycisphaerales bacterium]|nr:hypothetical protein [Phycisphaerales bacterium]MCB9862622.1 hypothetical protein [Phycisphaerales bacterium]
MIGVLVVLVIGGILSWVYLMPRQEVSPGLAEIKNQYSCSHCGNSFELSPVEVQEMLRTEDGITCPACGKIIDKADAVSQSRALGETDTGNNEDEAADADAPVILKPSGMRRTGG